jgi:fructose-bisphosphate aldolase class I
VDPGNAGSFRIEEDRVTPQDLDVTARALVAPGKGILAADEGYPSIKRRFAALGVPNTEETRRLYRQMLLTAPGIAAFISGVILFEETIGQRADDGTPFSDLLVRQGLIPGIKADTGLIPFPGSPGEETTEGLDGLPGRLANHRAMGARFAKWRAVYAIGPERPTPALVQANAHTLARYAAIAQSEGLVPIVEPEVLMDGDHPIERGAEITERILHQVFRALVDQGVRIEGILLKASMVLPGAGCPHQASPIEVADATLACLRRAVPAAVPGVVFLSGGQSDQAATANLNAMNRAAGPQPWQLSFSYGRALQASALRAWSGDPTRVAAGQHVFLTRARCTAAAREGRYTPDLERAIA